MNYLAGLLLLLCMALGLTASLYRSDALSWEGKYNGLVTTYNQTAQRAKDDAARQEQADQAHNQQQAQQAITRAAAATSQANADRAVYLKKLAGLNPTDCANQLIPPGLIP